MPDCGTLVQIYRFLMDGKEQTAQQSATMIGGKETDPDCESLVQIYGSPMEGKEQTSQQSVKVIGVKEKDLGTPTKYQCKYWACSLKYLRLRDLHLHQEKAHGAKNVTHGAFKCPTCERGYTVKKQMTRHIKNAHRLLKSEYKVTYTCNSCADAPVTFSNLKKHKPTGHVMIKMYSCVMRPESQVGERGFAGLKNVVLKIPI